MTAQDAERPPTRTPAEPATASGRPPDGADTRTGATRRPSARERLLSAADELFYEHGVHTVGIDRVIDHAGVSKASLYKVFGSKDELVRSYLERRHASRRERMLAAVARYDTPRDRLLGVFDVLAASSAEPGFRGCAFVNASAESEPGGSVEAASDESRAWLRSLFTELSAAAGVADPAGFARALTMLYDGATVAARMDRDPGAASTARAVAAAMLDAATVTATATAVTSAARTTRELRPAGKHATTVDVPGERGGDLLREIAD
jgi:AcrR family transcriptional regulator